jgi:GcrA cell cycle regulator
MAGRLGLSPGKANSMQSFIWAPEHSDALRDCLSRGMSYGQAASVINARFGTEFTRNAAIGRATRLGLKTAAGQKALVKPRRSARWGEAAPKPSQQKAPQNAARSDASAALAPVPIKMTPVKLRCVGIRPRLIAFDDLEPGDCRYPYGGEKEGETYAFCGHPRVAHSSYCRPHHVLTHGAGTASERMAVSVALRLVKAA